MRPEKVTTGFQAWLGLQMSSVLLGLLQLSAPTKWPFNSNCSSSEEHGNGLEKYQKLMVSYHLLIKAYFKYYNKEFIRQILRWISILQSAYR